jgi:hypothetical protein
MENTQKVLQEQREKNEKLDEKGRRMAQAAENMIRTTSCILQDYNSDEALQRFTEHAKEIAERIKTEANMKSGKIKEALDSLASMAPKIRSFIYDLFTNVEFRGLIVDWLSLFDSIFSRVAKESDNVNEAINQVTEEDKRRMTQKLTEFLVKIGENSKWKAHRQDLLQLFDYFREQAEERGIDPGFRTELSGLYYEGLQILQRFVDNRDLRPLHDSFWNLYREISSNEDARNYFSELKDWADRVVGNTASANSEVVVDQGMSLIGRGVHIVRDRYGEKIEKLFKEAKWILEKLGENKYAQEMKQDIWEFREAFSGSLLQVVGQMRYIALPVLREFIAQLPLPKISHSDETTNYTIDNMYLKGKELRIEDVSLYLKVSTTDLLELIVSVRDLKLSLSDIHFTYERTAIPKFSDQGICSADIRIPKMVLRWTVKEQDKGRPPRFQFEKMSTYFETVNINIEQAKHKLIDQVILTFMAGNIKASAQASLEESLKKQADLLSAKFDKFFIEQLVIPSPSGPAPSAKGVFTHGKKEEHKESQEQPGTWEQQNQHQTQSKTQKEASPVRYSQTAEVSPIH